LAAEQTEQSCGVQSVRVANFLRFVFVCVFTLRCWGAALGARACQQRPSATQIISWANSGENWRASLAERERVEVPVEVEVEEQVQVRGASASAIAKASAARGGEVNSICLDARAWWI